jgi:hypothetical protein
MFAIEPRFVGNVHLGVLLPDEIKGGVGKGHGHGTALLKDRAMAEAQTLRQHGSDVTIGLGQVQARDAAPILDGEVAHRSA